MKTTRDYVVLIETDKNTVGVIMPDFGYTANGKTKAEALKNAIETLENMLALTQKGGQKIPEKSDLNKVLDVMNDLKTNCPGIQLAAETLTVRLPESKAVPITITMPEDILNRLNQFLGRQKNKRSAFIADAVREKLATN